MRRGLTLGKFAPFHRGHQLLIETALAEVGELVVMVYATDLINVPLQVRAGWIKHLYPSVRILEAWDGPEGYGDHVSRALGAVDRRVDEARTAVPISGTQIRADHFSNRNYLDPVVYSDLITKVCFLGAPSTGKTTLSEALAKKHQTHWMPEYGAEFWLAHQIDRRITLDQFETIAPEHNRREDTLVLKARKYLFCDTCPITTYMFAKDYHGKAGPLLTRLAEQAKARYDIFVLCETDIPYADTWDRSGDVKRHQFQQQIIADLAERDLHYFRVSGTLESRVSQVDEILSGFSKYSGACG